MHLNEGTTMAYRFNRYAFVVLVAFAVGIVTCSNASATVTHKLKTFTGERVDITGTSSNTVFGVKSGSLEVKCKSGAVSFTPTLVNEQVNFLTFSASYSECTTDLFEEMFAAASVDMNGCSFNMGTTTTTSLGTTEGTLNTDAPIDLICPVGKSVTLTASMCTIQLSPGKGLHGIGFDNEGSGSTAGTKLTLTVDRLHYTTSGGFICSLGGLSATGNDMFMTGSTVLKGYRSHLPHVSGFHVGISFSSE